MTYSFLWDNPEPRRPLSLAALASSPSGRAKPHAQPERASKKPPLLHPMYSNGGGFSINRGSTPVCRSKPVTAACRAVILHLPTACCPGALYTAVCKQAPSQWPVLSAQTDAALLCPGKRICPFTGFIIAGCRAEVKAAGFFPCVQSIFMVSCKCAGANLRHMKALSQNARRLCSSPVFLCCKTKQAPGGPFLKNS